MPSASAAQLQVSSSPFDDPEGYPCPPSPGGSTKGLYVRSRATSMEGSSIDAPFAQFSLRPTIVPLPPMLPPAPKQNNIYAHSAQSMYFASSTINIRAIVIPVRAVRADLRDSEPEEGAAPRRSSWLKGVKKIVPGMLKRIKHSSTRADEMGLVGGEEEENTPLVQGSRARPIHSKSFSLSSRSHAKSPKSPAQPKSLPAGIENRPPPRAKQISRARSCSALLYMYHPDTYEDELDDNMPEVREALRINAGIHATGYRYERMDTAETCELEESMDSDDGWTAW
ncbi:hypothetical protein DFH09DRAFT_1181774 [Mycena vulgaris]|nr:hypothetical protein DFH09DRAFT_1181774 [Mycena vulgaris]